MSKQQTSVEWLIQQIAVKPDPNVEYYTCNGKDITKEVLEAKKLHRQQIIDAYTLGHSFYDSNDETSAEQYYNDKYGQ